MGRMMKVQMDHALTRLSEAYDDILGCRPEEDGHAKVKRMAQMLRTGKVKVTTVMVKRAISRFDRKMNNDRWPDRIEECLAQELRQNLEDKYTPGPRDPAILKWEARQKKLSSKYQETKDEIILGDVDRALKLIAEFRKTKV